MQWETATPLGFPVCMRHTDCGLKNTAECFVVIFEFYAKS